MTLTHKRRSLIFATGILAALLAGVGGYVATWQHLTLAGLDAASVAYLVMIFGGAITVVGAALSRAGLTPSIVMLNSGLLVIGVGLMGLSRHAAGDSAHWLEICAGLVFGADGGLFLAYWIHRRSETRDRGQGGPHN